MTHLPDTAPTRPLVVLASYREPRQTTNPYITRLTAELRADPFVHLDTFSFRTAILGRYDVVHAHWPEVMMSGHRRAGALARQVLTGVFLARLTLTRTPLVRTAHNLERPTGLSRLQRLLLAWFERLTVLQIALNGQTGAIVGGQVVEILHGDYRDRYATLDRPPAVRGRFGYVGLVRRYKGVEQLVEAFRGLPDDYLSLSIAGKPSTDELAGEIDALASGDARIATRWEFLSDADLARAVSESELVVLPYRHMHNSGAALTALSLSRPVLVPDNAVNRDLAAEVGPGWVITFEGDLDADDLRRALEQTRRPDRADSPDLSHRDWALAAPAHLAAYRRALEIRRG